MYAYEITPNSFCKGVERAITIIKDILKRDDVIKPIYMLGYLVHNLNVVNAFDDITIIPNNFEEEILKINEGTFIITAHGISPKIRDLIVSKNLHIIDTTCINVKRIHQSIIKHINNNYNVYLLGNEKHPEIQGYLGISNKVSMYNGYLNQNAYVTTQTTLVYDDVIKDIDDIKTKYPKAVIENNICNTTTNRQKALQEAINDNETDLYIIIGDKLSNNCKSLYDLVINHHKNAIIISSVNDLNSFDLSNYKKIGVTAGASTPKAILSEVIYCLNNNKPFVSTLNRKDYLKF